MDSSDDEQIVAKSRKRIATLDSDDDESDGIGNDSSQKILQKKMEEKNEDGDDAIDSESESGDVTETKFGNNESKLSKKNTRRAVFADSDDDEDDVPKESGSNQNTPSKKITSTSRSFSNKDDSDESSDDEGIEKKSVHNDDSSNSNNSESEGLYTTVRSEGFLYKVATPELKISPNVYFIMYNSVVLSKILPIIVP